MKKFIKGIIIISLLFNNTLIMATETEVCSDPTITDLFPMGDESGKSVFTQRETSMDCNVTIDIQGPCIKWEETEEKFGLDPDQYNTYRGNDNEGSIGSLFATVGAYDQLEHLWSGWHGYCERGTKHDFTWAEDPMYWASLAASAFLDSASSGGFGSDALASAGDAMQSGIDATLGAVATDYLGNMGQCLVGTGIDLAFAGASAIMDEDEPACDPVDEFCEEEEVIGEEDVFTITVEEYDNLLAEHPEAADYLVIIPPPQGNVLTVRYIQPSEVNGSDQMSEEQIKELQDEIKQMMLYIKMAVTVGKLAMCGVTGNVSSQVQDDSSDGDGRFSVQNGISMAINAIPAAWLGPYGPLIKAVAQVLLSVYNSFTDIDTCRIEEDAEEEGSRHLKTYESLQYDLCHLASKTCSQEEVFGDDCDLDGYNYCCYDQLLTKILVEQLKAQLGRDWAHCTGISLDDLKYVSFRECDAADKAAPLIDGAHQVNQIDMADDADDIIYDPTTSYQHVNGCIDLTEFKDAIKNIFNETIDVSDFDDRMQDLSDIANDDS